MRGVVGVVVVVVVGKEGGRGGVGCLWDGCGKVLWESFVMWRSLDGGLDSSYFGDGAWVEGEGQAVP